MITKLITITRNTFLESIRQPVFAVVTLAGVIVLAMSPSITGYTFDDDNKFLIDISMSTIMLLSTLLAAIAASGVLSGEIESRTVLLTVSKPVPRPLFVLGKYLGVVGAVAVGYWVFMLVFLLTLRHGVMSTASHKYDGPVLTFGLGLGFAAILFAVFMNYYRRWVFASTLMVALAAGLTVAWGLVLVVGKGWGFQPPTAEFTREDSIFGQLHIALLLIFQSVMFMTAIAIAVSTRMGQVMTLVVTLVVFVLGQVASSSLKRVAEQPQVNQPLLKDIARAVPNLQYFWHSDALIEGTAISGGHLAVLSLYAACFILAVLALAVALFQTREVGGAA